MLTQDEFQAELTQLRQSIATLQEKRDALNSLLEIAKAREDHLSALCTGQEPWLEYLSQASPAAHPAKKQTDIQILLDVLKDHGPLHVTDIVRLARSRGVSFYGKKPPTLMARDKVYRSKKFHNFGGNVWGLLSQSLKETATISED